MLLTCQPTVLAGAGCGEWADGGQGGGEVTGAAIRSDIRSDIRSGVTEAEIRPGVIGRFLLAVSHSIHSG